jgi:hypothetical protein
MDDVFIYKGAPIQSMGLLILAVYFGYTLYKMVRGAAFWYAATTLGGIYYGYLLATWPGASRDDGFFARFFAATVGAVLQIFLGILQAFGADFTVK